MSYTLSAPKLLLPLLAGLLAVFGGSLALAAKGLGGGVVGVERGDSLERIGRRYGASVAQLMRWNKLKTTRLQPGQRLRVTPPLNFAVKLSRTPVLGVPVVAIHVNLGDPQVSIRPLMPAGLGQGAPLEHLSWRTQLVGAINGGYFHPRTFWPAGDLVVEGRKVVQGSIHTALAITPDGRARVLTIPGPVSWKGYRTVIANGPYILRKGHLVVAPQNEGYRDPSIWGRARRSAVGIVNERYLIFVSIPMPVTLSELGKVMTKLGVREALVLDGGSSTGIIWRNQTLVRPGRPLAYGIGIFLETRPPTDRKS
ncbi:MAG: phosphodiester glycosidase family protein [Thermaceae bacterium]|nr:phosphodiester glycosidase family protein [Thermaceae bacterium]